MVYLLLKITFCLLLAGIFGAIIGWLLKHIFAQKHNDEQRQRFDVERQQHKKDLTQVESDWNSKYQSLNTTRNKIQGLLNTSTQENTLLSQSVKTTQQTLNDQGEMLKRLQGDMRKLGATRDDLQNKNDLLAQEVVHLRNENKQIAILEDNIIQLNHTQSSLETTLKEAKTANEAAKANLLKKHHDLEKSNTVLESKLNTAMNEHDHAKHTLARLKKSTEKEQQKSDELMIEKQQLLSIQQDKAVQQSKNNEIIITLKDTLEKTAKNNRILKNEVTALQHTAADIPKLKEKSMSLEKDNKKLEETLQENNSDTKKIKQFEATIDLLKEDNSILKKDNQENHKKNTQLNSSLNHTASEMERYKRYIMESEKTWATKVYALQKQVEPAEKSHNKEDKIRIQTLNNRIADFKEERTKRLDKIKHLTNENKQYQTDKNLLETLKKQLTTLTKERDQLTNTLAKNKTAASNDENALKTSIKQLKTALNDTKLSAINDKRQLQEKVTQLNSKLNETKTSSKNNKQQQEKINQLNTELDNAKSSLLSNRNKKEQLQTNIIQLNKKLANAQSSSVADKKRFQAKINQFDHEQEAAYIAQQAMDSCKQKLAAIESNNAQLNKTLKTLTAQNQHTKESLSTTQLDYIDLSKKHKALKLELKQLHQQKPKVATINKARADDLQKIKGIGKHNERILNKLGITHYAQIAHFSQQDEEKFGKELGVFASRISQEAWVGQAKILHQDKYAENI